MNRRSREADRGARPPMVAAGVRALTGSADVVALFVMLAFGVLYLALALRMPFGTLQAPATGLFPRVIAVLILVATGLSLFFRLVRHKLVSAPVDDEDPAEREFGEAFWRVPALIACLVLYVGLAPWLGHIISSSLVSFLVLLMLNQRARWQMAALSIAFGFATYGLFHTLLNVPLPTGVWRP